MARTPHGKSKFYKGCRFDEDTVRIIRWYNKHLADWKQGKNIYLSKDKDETQQ